MKAVRIIGADSKEIAPHIAYDPNVGSLLLSGRTMSLLTEDAIRELALPLPQGGDTIPAAESSNRATEKQDPRPYLHFETAKTEELMVSHSGK